MKKLIQDIAAAFKIMLRFSRQHYATLEMIEGMYVKETSSGELVAGLDTAITIKATGNLFQVTRTDYISNIPENEEKWMATYGWHSNGHLIELGGDRYCVFEAASKSLYLESTTQKGNIMIELFIKISKQ